MENTIDTEYFGNLANPYPLIIVNRVAELLGKSSGEFSNAKSGSNLKTWITVKESYDPVIKHIEGWVYSLIAPAKWLIDGINPPNYACKELTEKVSKKLYKAYSIIPQRISVTIEEGLFLRYFNSDNQKVLAIEIYNDLDAVAIVTKGKDIIKAVDIINEDFSEIIQFFQKR